MILGRVVGELWATHKDDRLERAKLLVVRPHGWYDPRWQTDHLVAVDDVHAGVGDDVVVCLGQPARWSRGGEDIPVDAAVMAIVDRVDLDADAATPAHAGPGIARRWDPPARWTKRARAAP